MPQNVLTENKYAKLVKDIRRIIEEGKRRAAQAASQELVVTYWEIGKRITEENLTQNAGYGEAVLADLADELGMDYSTLRRCSVFFSDLQIGPAGPTSHLVPLQIAASFE